MTEEIRSLQNDRVKFVVRLLRDASARRETGLTAVEGAREIERALASGWTPRDMYFCPEQADPAARALVREAERKGATVFSCTVAVSAKIAYRENPDGVVAVGPVAGRRLDELVLPNVPLVLVTENVEKPGNLGALLRTADAAGVDAVVACGEPDLGNPNLVRASVGTVFYLPVATSTPQAAVDWLRRRRLRIATTEPAAEREYTDADLTGPLAIVVGAEDTGVSEVWRQEADLRVRIPMLGRNDSLNVSVAAAVLIYEAVRQRRRDIRCTSGEHSVA